MNSMQRVKVWDPWVRVFHWSLVLCVSTAYLTGEEWLTVHTWAGYSVLALLLLRLIWGFIGSPHARFRDFIYPPGQVWRYLGGVLRGHAPRYLGHNPAGGAMIIALLLSLAITVTSGLLLYGFEEFSGPLAEYTRSLSPDWGPLIETTHEIFANLCIGLAVLHVLGVILASVQHRENLIAAMLTGKKRVGD